MSVENIRVLFLCPHNAAKGVIAAELFNQLMEEKQLSWVADSAGTEPDSEVMPATVELLNERGIDVSAYKPRHVTEQDFERADYIISMGCDVAELSPLAAAKITDWSDIPPVSQQPKEAFQAISRNVEKLIATLRST